MKINLRELRLEKGYTVRDLEKLSGVSHSHISMIENGERMPTNGFLHVYFLLIE